MDSVDIAKFPNVDLRVSRSFSEEWARFPQDKLSPDERERIFLDYFDIFPWSRLREDAVGADLGCGSGRWAGFVAPRTKELFCLDVSREALAIAQRNLSEHKNIKFRHASVGDLPFEDSSLHFAYSLGVLHHLPDPQGALKSIAKKMKPGAPLLIYVYYAFDNRPKWYQRLWLASDLIRSFISSCPIECRFWATQVLALCIYWPLSRVARVLDSFGILPESWPLSYYRDKSLYVISTDALDRFGTPLEKRFTREEVRTMLKEAGFGEIRFSDGAPHWVAVGIRMEEALSEGIPERLQKTFPIQ